VDYDPLGRSFAEGSFSAVAAAADVSSYNLKAAQNMKRHRKQQIRPKIAGRSRKKIHGTCIFFSCC
jgi:hypothetical protein